MQCPCSSGKLYADCCEPYHQGTLPLDPLALMRSRYSAYALKRADYIIQTTHPQSPYFERNREKWKEAILQFCDMEQFLKLEILESKENWVHFIAHLGSMLLDEKSYFEKLDGKWYYTYGERY